jgi:hypothetical protein
MRARTGRLPEYRDEADAPHAASPEAPPAPLPLQILALQRQAGNAAVARLIAGNTRTPRPELTATPAAALQRTTTTMVVKKRPMPTEDESASDAKPAPAPPDEFESVDITQVDNQRIREIIAELGASKDGTRAEELELARTYLKKREAALQVVDDFVSGKAPATSPEFKRIQKTDVASHLRTTIEEPSAIHQQNMNWCGPNVFLMVIARNDPVAYARYAVDMYEHGSATLGAGLRVKPTHSAVTGGWKSKMAIKSADWMSLGSLRDSSNKILSATENVTGFATFPSHIIKWFKKYGVAADKIVERGGFITQTNDASLREANQLFSAGWNVLLWVHLKTLNKRLPDVKAIPMGDISNTHWVVMDGEFVSKPAENSWSCKANTYGSRDVRTVLLSERNISSGLFGFVAVDMQAKIKDPTGLDESEEASGEDGPDAESPDDEKSEETSMSASSSS